MLGSTQVVRLTQQPDPGGFIHLEDIPSGKIL